MLEKNQESKEGGAKKKILGKVIALAITGISMGVGLGIYRDVQKSDVGKEVMTRVGIEENHDAKSEKPPGNLEDALERFAELPPVQREDIMSRLPPETCGEIYSWIIYDAGVNDKLTASGARSASIILDRSYQRQTNKYR